jgi:general secretion pathway protein J
MRSSVARPAGFTLIELLVAISVLAIVAVLGWRGLDSIVRTRVSLNEELKQTRGLQLTFAQMQNDCARIADRSDANGQLETMLVVDPGRLTMVRNVFVENEPSRLQVIAYRLNDGMLTRRESVPTRDILELRRIWQAFLADMDTSTPVTLQDGVTAMNLRTWQGKAGWGGAGGNGNGSPPAATSMVPVTPLGLEVVLQARGAEHSMTKIFLLGAI